MQNTLTTRGLANLENDSYIEIVYVKDSSKVKTETLHNWNKIGVTNIQKDKLNGIERKFIEAGVNYQVNILNGEPGPTIVEHANDHNFDVVIIGSRGLNAFQEMVLGSVSHKVAKRANCPVLIIK
ncbi:universal stress protein [Aquisalibacillus elongatus]|uniref:Nucleotide-binding universal stress UspA family protein n=1 Tax=Aquisalibacillus elongatus TaxID=485577 RepID=A0A3N5BUN5_9BACI|nr:universal stress protein [Aquisalibacillus elongatus]RPF53478.1 nucleotide-binding universal stress UspA family protein [Aquisalibacillus elongatus]